MEAQLAKERPALGHGAFQPLEAIEDRLVSMRIDPDNASIRDSERSPSAERR